MFRFEGLKVYQDSISLSGEIYSLTKSWPKEETFGLTNQIRRASFSVALNIAEGTSRGKREFAHFLDMASGSCFETVACLQIANQNGYIPTDTQNKFYIKLSNLSKMISGLKNKL